MRPVEKVGAVLLEQTMARHHGKLGQPLSTFSHSSSIQITKFLQLHVYQPISAYFGLVTAC